MAKQKGGSMGITTGKGLGKGRKVATKDVTATKRAKSKGGGVRSY